MKKFLIMALSLIVLSGCGGNVEEVDVVQDEVVVKDCVLGEVYSLDELAFDVCSANEVSVGEVENNLRPIFLSNDLVGFVVEGDYENENISVVQAELIEALENNDFGGIESKDDNGFGANYIDIAGFDVIELDFLGDLEGTENYFTLVDGQLLKFYEDLGPVLLLSGVMSN